MKKLKLLSFGLLSVLLTFTLFITGTNKVYASNVLFNIDSRLDFNLDEIVYVASHGGGDFELELDSGDNYFAYDGRIDFWTSGTGYYLISSGNHTIPFKQTMFQLTEDSGSIYLELFSHSDGSRLKIENNSFKIIKGLPNSTPAISGQHTVINNVDSPYSETQIRQYAGLKAIDDYYGDLTSSIQVVRDTYTPNNKKVGNWEIEYKVTNPSNLSATFTLKVANKDLTPPVITGPGTSTISYTEQFNISNITSTYAVSDNHDTSIQLSVESNTYSGDKIGKPGTYQIKLTATDQSGNKTSKIHTLTVIDDVKPVITDEHQGSISINWKDKVNNEMLLLGLTGHDAIDGAITNKITVIENNITQELGTYQVKYELVDNAGNKTVYTRTYKVITTDVPVFWVSSNLLLISDVNYLNADQLAQELARYEGINMASYRVISNKYEGNEDNTGDYNIIFAIADKDGEEHTVTRTVRVFAENELPENELNFFQKVGKFFTNLWNGTVKIFNWTWNGVKSIWNFVFGWMGKSETLMYFR